MKREVPRRLPMVLDPFPDEPWSNYLERLATGLAVSTRALRVHLGMPPSRYGEMSYREHGIAMTTRTAAFAAETTRLDVRTVKRMQLQRFNHTLLRMDDDFVASVDPLAKPGRSNAGGLRLQQKGSAHYHASTHACPACLAERPHRWRIQWRLRWHVVCPEHGLLIDQVGLPATRPSNPDRLIEAQQRVMRLAQGAADPSGRSAWSIVNDAAAAIEVELFPRTPPSRRGENVPTPRQLSELMPAALQWATRPSKANLTLVRGLRSDSAWASNAAAVVARRRLGNESVVRAAVENARRAPAKRHRRPAFEYTPPGPRRPTDTRTQSGYAAMVPQLLPERLFNGRLSDLLYPMPLIGGRNIASVAIVVAGLDVNPRRAVELLGLPPRSVRRLKETFAEARERGSDDALWVAVRKAGDALESESTDYGYRRRAVRDPKTIRIIMQSLSGAAPEHQLHRWLLEWWALDYIRSAHRREVTATQNDAAGLEASVGRELRSVLATTAEAAAAS